MHDMSVCISIGHDADIGLDDRNNLIVAQQKRGENPQRINLGPMNETRARELKLYMDRLNTFTEE